MFYGLATNQAYFKDRLNLFVALAPVVRLDKSDLVNFLSVLAKFDWFLEAKLAEAGVYELFGKGWEEEFEKIIKAIPGLNNLRNHEKLSNDAIDNAERAKVFEGHFPHGSSIRAVVHYSQIYNKKKFAYYDYRNATLNKERYGTETAPEISMESIGADVPIAMFVGKKDNIVSVEDNRVLRRQL